MPVLAIERGRHPLLGERAVPQSLAVDDATRLLVISGPNMGGKTVALKMVGLFVVMTYCGMQVPAADGTRVGRFERVIADIGDEQSIVANASTFSAHFERMREMLDGADARTLVIVDEIGGGTEPSAGAALAIAMLERLLESRRARDRHDARDRAETLRARHGRASPTRACASIRRRSRRRSSSTSARPDSRWRFRWPRASASIRQIVERAQSVCSSGASATTKRRWPSSRCATRELRDERDALGGERARLASELETRCVATRERARTRSGAASAPRRRAPAAERLRDFVARAAADARSRRSQTALLAETIERCAAISAFGPRDRAETPTPARSRPAIACACFR